MDRIQQLQAFLAANPSDSFLRHALGLEYSKLGDEHKAREVFEALLAENPAYVGTYYQLGKLLERTGEVEEAIRVYQKGLEMARAAGDQHAYNELQAALEDLTF
jgi:tetratricopeptide (TPR) repeat protein